MFIAFGLAALLKTSQGSSTSAIIITSATLAPLLETADFTSTLSIALLITTIGSGAMTVSHANDSYFWVVTQFSGFSVQQAYKQYTLMTLLKGLTGFVASALLYLLMV